jgi:signal transduction histidine kinase
MTIRAHLLLLAFAAVALVHYERETQRIGAVDQARAMIIAVDAELRGTIATLNALAASRALAADDLRSFHAAAGKVLATQPAWLSVTLAQKDGREAVNLAVAPEAVLGAAADAESIQRVFATSQPVVGDVMVDKLLGTAGVPVHVPVIREGKTVYVLTAIVRPEVFRGLIIQQSLPQGWICGIVDRNMRFVVRVPAVAAGSLASEAFRAASSRRPEGWYRGLTIEGFETFTAHTTSPFSGWSIGLGIPISSVEAAARRSAWLLTLGATISVGLAFAFTIAIGRRIANPIRSLATAAQSLGRGGDARIEEPERVREISAVAAALQAAAVAVRERQDLLEREKEALQASDAAKDEFLAMLSHELRNPLAALTSAAHILKIVDPNHPAASRARTVIERQTGQMTRLIEDLLDVSRITMGKASLERQRLDLAEAVSRVIDTWRTAGRISRHQLEVRASPVWINADRGRIDQILSNLLDNAIKFTPEGGKITVTVKHENGAAVLQLADEGEGIPEELLGRVFELFVQGPRGIDRGKGGMGIGLALVKRLTEMHGGTVSVLSDGHGKGSTFTVRFRAGEVREALIDAKPRA